MNDQTFKCIGVPLLGRLANICLCGCATSAAYAFVLFMTVVR